MTATAAMRRRRGEPLAALVLLLAGWAGARAMLWESPFDSAIPIIGGVAAKGGALAIAKASVPGLPDMMQVNEKVRPVDADGRSVLAGQTAVPPRDADLLSISEVAFSPLLSALPATKSSLDRPSAAPSFAPVSLPLSQASSSRRWHVDSWIAWRAGSGLPSIATGSRPPSYGGTQVGAVVRFDLAESRNRPAIYARATYAPDRPPQTDLAAGVGVRPIATVPVRVMAEVRATRFERETEVRPAVFAVTELGKVGLPVGLTGEGYAQGGWVGGRYATLFADGQARITRAVAVGPARLQVGAAVWGGAQKFAERVDVGPTIALEIANTRLSFDYRAKVMGNAAPGDGLALTLSTGF